MAGVSTRAVPTARSGVLNVTVTTGERQMVTLDDRKSVFVLSADEARTVGLRLIEAAARAEREEGPEWP